MNDKRDFDRAVGRWLDDGSDATPPEVINAVLLAVRSTPQERDFRVPWRNTAMTSYLRFAAVIALAAIVSTAAISMFGLRGSGIGRMGASPSPSPSLIARGTFVEHDWGPVEFEATRAGSSVTGHMTVGEGEGPGWPLTVDLQCIRETDDGLIMIGGALTDDGGPTDGRPDGTPPWRAGILAWIALEHGTPDRASVGVGFPIDGVGSPMDGPATETTDCPAYLDTWLQYYRTEGYTIPLEVLDGGVEFGPSLPDEAAFEGTSAPPSPSPALLAPSLRAPIDGAAANGVIALAKDGDIVVADRPGGDTRPLVAGPEDDSSPVFSPDGTQLAFVRGAGQGSFPMVADADGTNVVQLTQQPLEIFGWPWSFAPDGRSLMTVAHIDGALRVVVRPVDPAAALAVLDIRLPDADQVEDPRFHPTNPQEILVVGQLVPDGPRGLYVYNLATGGIRSILEPADDQYVGDVAWLPDGEHITYSLGLDAHVVAADGSGDQAFDVLRDRVSPFSNDGTRIVAQGGGDDEAEPWAVIVPINGDGESVVLACAPRTDIECPHSPPPDWIWSPDDSMLIGTVYDDTSSSGEGPLTETYLLVDARTGQVTELDWRDVGTPAWQRVAP